MRTLMLAGLALLVAGPLAGQDFASFQNQMRQNDPEKAVIIKMTYPGEKLAYIYVTDTWYALPCFKRQRFAKGVRRIWRSHGGSNIVVFDRAGTEVADFKMFGSDFDVRGCDG